MSSSQAHTSTAETDQNARLCQFGPGLNKNNVSFYLERHEYIEDIKEVQIYLDKVKKIVKPGCSQEVLNAAVSSLSSLVRILSVMSTKSKPHASL